MQAVLVAHSHFVGHVCDRSRRRPLAVVPPRLAPRPPVCMPPTGLVDAAFYRKLGAQCGKRDAGQVGPRPPADVASGLQPWRRRPGTEQGRRPHFGQGVHIVVVAISVPLIPCGRPAPPASKSDSPSGASGTVPRSPLLTASGGAGGRGEGEGSGGTPSGTREAAERRGGRWGGERARRGLWGRAAPCRPLAPSRRAWGEGGRSAGSRAGARAGHFRYGAGYRRLPTVAA